MSSSEVIDAPLVSVPLASLRRAAKDRKAIIDEASAAVLSIAKDKSLTKEQQLQQLDSLVNKLQGLKRKLVDVAKAEKDEAHRCKARLEHLQALGPPPRGAIIPWTKQRLDRILVDHLLRSGYHATATKLAEDSNIVDLVDIHIFQGARRVVESLNQHDCSSALEWCLENQSRLKKIKSKLEFKLRVQEFIELVRQESRLEAIYYARKHLAQWASQYMEDLQRAVAALAFKSDTRCPPYKVLFDESQWDSLKDLFYKDLYRLHSLTPESLLTIHLQAGLAALKTPLSLKANCSKEDPLHLASFRSLAEGLPYAKHVHSKLICSVTKELMNESNPAMVLPNGYVYSQKATELIMAKNDGKMICPSTGIICTADELRRAFIV